MSEDIHDKILQDFSQTGPAQKGPSYGHPQQDEIIKLALDTLSAIPEGVRQIRLIKDLNLSIRVIAGKEPDVTSPDGQTVVLIMPKAWKTVDPDVLACNLGIGIKENEINMVNIQRLSGDPAAIAKKAADIIIHMCRLVSEFYDVHKNENLVVLLEKLGHIDTYKLYRSKASYQEMLDQALKSIT